MTNQEIYKYFQDINSMDEEKKIKNSVDIENQNDLNSLNLRLCEPFIEVNDYNLDNKNTIVQSSIKLTKEFLNDIVSKNTNEWIDKLFENKDEFDIKHHVAYEETRNKRIRRQLNASTKKKDFHKIFNKYLKIS